jgi:hypothetical protein
VSYSIRKVILLDGVLRGMDLQAHCKIRAVKVCLPKLDIWEYVAADVVQAPNDLPAGAYEVTFEGRKVKVHGWATAPNAVLIRQPNKWRRRRHQSAASEFGQSCTIRTYSGLPIESGR